LTENVVLLLHNIPVKYIYETSLVEVNFNCDYIIVSRLEEFYLVDL